MCGITGGFWRANNQQISKNLAAAVASMRLRGPNDQGYDLHSVADGIVGLGHVRLSIIDLSSSGHQPMYSTDKRLGLVFNGEIYNYRELRTELSRLGYKFFSDSDTEVLLTAWQHWGRDCLSRLVGMFAFVIFDRKLNKLICVRDAFGIKPFFYTVENENFLFGSEIAAIKALKNKKVELDWQRAYDYLAHGDYDTSPRSFFAGVSHLMPGYTLEVDLNSGMVMQPVAWWQPSIIENNDISFVDATHILREKFLDNIRLHLRSDVPLGAALSGGVDSSTIVCAMRYVEPDMPIHTFSYIAKDRKISEEVWIDKVNKHVGAVPHKVFASYQDLASDLDDMIIAQGEPFGGSSIYAQYRIYKLAKENGITVTLDGQGADELLAGYQGYPGKRVKSLIDGHHYIDAANFLINWSRWPNRDLSHGLKLSIAEMVHGKTYDVLRELNGMKIVPNWLNGDVLQEAGVALRYPRQISSSSDDKERRLMKGLSFDLTSGGLPKLLRHGDRNSMRFSVESRVPFLTTDMADFLLSLPESYLISQQGETKRIFRAAMRDIVPNEILDRRDKVGFETPEENWLLSLSEVIRISILEDVQLGFLNQQAMLTEFDLIVAGKKRFDCRVWRWVNFMRWYIINF
jgi:asparagine synthase (glutamine-hydrolysing)